MDTIKVCINSPLVLSGNGGISYSWAGPQNISNNTIFNVTTSGVYTLTVTNVSGCTATKSIYVLVKATSSNSTPVSVCSNSLPYTWNGTAYNAAGTFTKTFTNAVGCDSTATLVLTVKVTSSSTTNTTICPSALPYSWNGSRASAGTYTFTTINSQGCDSVATLNLTVKTTSASTTDVSICSSALPYDWNGSRTAAGTYTFTTTNSQGCDSIATLNLTVKTTSTSTTNVSICPSALPYSWNGSRASAGTYTYTTTNSQGCDSVATLNLFINSTTSTTTTAVALTALPYMWNGVSYYTTGTYSNTFTGGNSNGCDSTATLNLSIASEINTSSQWTWKSGDNSNYNSGVYGIKGTAAASNKPGARYSSVSWKDASGNLWLFGGIGMASSGDDYLNDLWKYNTSTSQWTWVSGDNTTAQFGVYGTKGTAAASNKPGARYQSVSWTDSSGNLWLFGGNGYAASGYGGNLNDLWKYNTNTGEWTWISGDNTRDNKGDYGTKGMAATTNKPGARMRSVSWTDASGNLWLFGGAGYDVSGNRGSLNDLWKYNTNTGEWTWISGDNTRDNMGAYGTKGTATASNKPGARYSSVSWADASGNLWLFGGVGYAASGSDDYLNDLWKYNIGTNKWTWVSGDSTLSQLGVCGTKGTAAASNKPGARQASVSWADASGDLWLFGGAGYDVSGLGLLNDLWKYNTNYNQWTWVSGDNNNGQSGVYGTKSTAATANKPGSRQLSVSWSDASGNLWLFGGGGYATSSSGYLNDLWKIAPICSGSTATQTQCGGSYLWNGVTYTTSGTYTQTFTGATGCDSLAILNLTINSATTSTTNVSICPSELPYSWNGSRVLAGTYTYTTTNSQGCDSVATLNLTINNATRSSSFQTACGSYLWNGVTYNTSGVYIKTFTGSNSVGCDSVATLNLTINIATTSTNIATSCGSYVWNGVTYTTSGAKTKTFTGGNGVGCDSVAILNLIITDLPNVNQPSNQVLCSNNATAAINFSGTNSNTFIWANNNTAIGLAAGGKGDIASFTALNATGTTQTATITVQPETPAFAYIAQSNNVVSVINTLTNAVVASIPVGYSPTGTSISPDGTKAYVCNYSSNDLSVISTATNAVIATITCGTNPNGVATSPDGTKVYVTNSNSNNVSVIDAITNTVTDNISIGFASSGICVSADGSKVYVVNSGSNSVSVISTVTKTVTATITVGSYPSGLAISPDGSSVYVSNHFGASVSVINTANNTVAATITVGTQPYGVTFSPDGSKVYVSNYGSANVSAINTATNTVSATFNVGNNPSGTSISPDGTSLYVTLGSSAIVNVINTATNTISNSITTTGGSGALGSFVAVTGCKGNPVNFTITVNPSATSTTNISICPSELPYSWNGNRASAGTYTFTTTNSVGCDSVATLNLTVKATSSSSTPISVCSNSLPYTWNGTAYNAAGTYTYTTTNSQGCDSVPTLNLTINSATTSTNTASICSNQLPYSWNGLTFTTAGSLTATLINAAGCDSLATLDLTIKNTYYYSITSSAGGLTGPGTNVAICEGNNMRLWFYPNSGYHVESVYLDGIKENVPPYSYFYIFPNPVTANHSIQVNYALDTIPCLPVNSNTTLHVCSSQVPYNWNGTIMTISGTGGTNTTPLQTSCGADSTAFVYFIIDPDFTITATAGTGGLISPNGATAVCQNTNQTYSISPQSASYVLDSVIVDGVYVGKVSSYTFNNVMNNHSIRVIYKYICTPNSSNTSASICSGDSYIFGAKNYNTAGTHQVHLTNAAGCDSLATLNLTVNEPTNSTTTANICVTELPYNWNGVNYNSGGSYTIHLTNAAGCDSATTLNLTTNPLYTIDASAGSNGSISNSGGVGVCLGSNSNMYVITANAGYHIADVLIDGISVGAITTYRFININANHTIRAIFALSCSPSTSSTSYAACNSYLWNGTTYTNSGSYTINLTNTCGSDSAATLNLTIKTATTSITNLSICSSQLPYSWNGSRASAGTYTYTTTNSQGCDSVATLVLTVKATTTSTSNANVCANQLPYSWNWLTFNAAGSQTATLTNSVGCDSTATLNLTVGSPVTPSISINNASSIVCSGNNVTFNAAITNGGASPIYTWKKNSSIVGTGASITFLAGTLATGDTISCVLTANNPCQTTAISTSNKISITVNASPVVGAIINYKLGGAVSSALMCSIGDTLFLANYTATGVWASTNSINASVTTLPYGHSKISYVLAKAAGTATIN